MSKEIFKEIPQGFHEQFLDTLQQLESEQKPTGVKKFAVKKTVLLVAAIVAAMGTLTAGAVGIFKWHEAAKERLGVSEEVADKLVMEGVAKEEYAVVEKDDVTIEAVMSVGTDRGYYLLFRVAASEKLMLTENTSFAQLGVVSDKEFAGITCGMMPDSLEGNAALFEVELLRKENMDYAGEEVGIQFIHFAETDKVSVTEVLVESTWEIPITLPSTQESGRFAQSGVFTADFHQLNITGVEISSSVIRLYGEHWRDLYHVTDKQSIQPPTIRYKDGTLLQPHAGVGQTGYNGDTQTEEGYVEFRLDVTMDVENVEALLFEDCEIVLGESMEPYGDAFENPCNMEEVIKAENPEDLKVLYVYHTNHAVIYDEQKLYLWDTVCNHAEELVDLKEIGYNAEAGGEMLVSPGQMMRILPNADSDKVYIVRLGYGLDAENKVIESPRESAWDNANWVVYTMDVPYRVVSEDGSFAGMRLEEVE